jgi:hypothetical protein
MKCSRISEKSNCRPIYNERLTHVEPQKGRKVLFKRAEDKDFAAIHTSCMALTIHSLTAFAFYYAGFLFLPIVNAIPKIDLRDSFD